MKKEDYNIIERYFNSELSETERQNVLKQCENDASFAAAFERQRLLLEIVDEDYENHLRMLLQKKEAELNDNQKSKTTVVRQLNSRRIWLAAASVLLLIVAGWWLAGNFSTPQNEDFFAQNFEPYRNYLVPIERNSPNTNDLQKSFQYYENQQFTEAINGFENILKDSLSADILFYKGVAELATTQNELSIESLEKAVENKTQFEEEARWFLILAHYKMENFAKAKALKQAFLQDFPNSEYVERLRVYDF